MSDDAAADVLAGSTGRDWFLAAGSGVSKDLFTSETGELVTVVS